MLAHELYAAPRLTSRVTLSRIMDSISPRRSPYLGSDSGVGSGGADSRSLAGSGESGEAPMPKSSRHLPLSHRLFRPVRVSAVVVQEEANGYERTSTT